jgi:hypothetical protein
VHSTDRFETLARTVSVHASLQNLFVGGSVAPAPINLGLRGLLTIRLDIFSTSREIETILKFKTNAIEQHRVKRQTQDLEAEGLVFGARKYL